MTTSAARRRGEILLVERNAFQRETASAWLRAHDYAVREVANQSDAIAQLSYTPYDVVVADIRLVSDEALTLVVWLAGRHPRIPVIGMLREQLTPEARGCARQLGIRQLLVKPYSLAALSEAVKCTLTAHFRDRRAQST
jgi:DNA-binding NtrC family response regulator